MPTFLLNPPVFRPVDRFNPAENSSCEPEASIHEAKALVAWTAMESIWVA
jgi:hypothetical protein